MKENKLRYAVSATNDQGAKIGEGLHRRALINTGRSLKNDVCARFRRYTVVIEAKRIDSYC